MQTDLNVEAERVHHDLFPVAPLNGFDKFWDLFGRENLHSGYETFACVKTDFGTLKLMHKDNIEPFLAQ